MVYVVNYYRAFLLSIPTTYYPEIIYLIVINSLHESFLFPFFPSAAVGFFASAPWAFVKSFVLPVCHVFSFLLEVIFVISLQPYWASFYILYSYWTSPLASFWWFTQKAYRRKRFDYHEYLAGLMIFVDFGNGNRSVEMEFLLICYKIWLSLVHINCSNKLASTF